MFADLYFYISKIVTPLIVPSNILIFLLIIFFYVGFIKDKIFVRKFFILIFIIFSIISVFPVGNNLIYFFLEKKFYNPETPSKIDYIFVPSGSINRTIFALNFLNNSNLKEVKIIFSSGNPYLNKNNSLFVKTIKKFILNLMNMSFNKAIILLVRKDVIFSLL